MEGVKEYNIGGAKFLQKPIVLGQLRQLLAEIQGVQFSTEMSTMQLVNSLGEKLPRALAIILVKEGTATLKGRDIDALADEISDNMTTDVAAEVIGDFFEFMPVSSLLGKLGGLVEKWTAQMTQIGSKISPSSLQGETSSSGMN